MSYPRPLTRHTAERERLAQFLTEGRHRLTGGRCLTHRQIGTALGIPPRTVYQWLRDLHPEVAEEIKRAPLMAKIMAEAGSLD